MATRTRGERYPMFVQTYSLNGICAATPSVVSKTLYIPLGLYEVIKDESPKRIRYGNCYHYRHETTMVDKQVLWRQPNTTCSGTPQEDAEGWYSISPGYAFASGDMLDCNVGYVLDQSQLNAEAFAAMKPSLDSGFSLSQFIYELKEVKTMFRFWNKSKTIVSNIASGHLNWSFGWAPFIADLFEIYNKLTNLEKILRDYKSRAGQPQVRHFKKVLIDNENFEESFGADPLQKRRVKGTRTVTFYATMKYTYTIPSIDRQYARLKGILDILGIRMGPSFAWEILPFSFVVDWFFNVGDFLSQFEEDNLDSKVTIIDYCYSVKESVVQDYYYDLYLSLNDPIYLGRSRISIYTRKRSLPSQTELFGLTQSHKYGTKQIVLSGALLLS